MKERNIARVQDKGQVTLPAELRRKLGLKKGDLVAFVETPEGVLISPQEVVATRALNQIGDALRRKGVTLDELIESGREERDALLTEQYDIQTAARPRARIR